MAGKRQSAWLPITVAVLIAAVAAGAWFLWRSGAGNLDPATGCARTTPPARHLIVLVDVAGDYDPRERRRAAAALREARAGLAGGDRITIAAPTDADPARAAILFSRCAPARMEMSAVEAFDSAYADAATAAAAGRPGDTAPVTEALRTLAASATARTPTVRRDWLFVSDMMENRPGVFSLYAAGATFETFRASEAGLRPVADLNGAVVRVVQLERTDRGARQRDARDLFWRPYFEAAGVRSAEWTP